MDAARRFFAEHYPSVARLIDELLADFSRRGVTTRRNWWLPLAGGVDGKPLFVGGREFPVLEVAQLRQGLPVTPNALRRKPGEPDPPGFRSGKWAARDRRGSGSKKRSKERKR